ncbi:MAG TPA: SWIM zinc finger family protein [Candidatus Dojkabacteria bacterium]|nr:SWIM zinc finger family protein [Candidatus Dojkabacteria bacterium]
MVGRIEKGITIPDIELVYTDDNEFYQFHILGNELYEVTYDEGFIYCDCPDYMNRHLNEQGSFLCKHCIKALNTIFLLKSIKQALTQRE